MIDGDPNAIGTVGSFSGAGDFVNYGRGLVLGSTNNTATFSGGSLKFVGSGTQIVTGTGWLDGFTICACGSGTGSFIIRGGSLTFGSDVEVLGGTLVVDQGGSIDTGGAGFTVASSAVIDGAGTEVTVGTMFAEGYSDPASVTISGGATVTASDWAGVSGYGATASVLVTGAGSSWSVGGSRLMIGDTFSTDASSVTAANGGALRITSGDLGIAQLGTLNIGDGGRGAGRSNSTPASSSMMARSSPISSTLRRLPQSSTAAAR